MGRLHNGDGDPVHGEPVLHLHPLDLQRDGASDSARVHQRQLVMARSARWNQLVGRDLGRAHQLRAHVVVIPNVDHQFVVHHRNAEHLIEVGVARVGDELGAAQGGTHDQLHVRVAGPSHVHDRQALALHHFRTDRHQGLYKELRVLQGLGHTLQLLRQRRRGEMHHQRAREHSTLRDLQRHLHGVTVQGQSANIDLTGPQQHRHWRHFVPHRELEGLFGCLDLQVDAVVVHGVQAHSCHVGLQQLLPHLQLHVAVGRQAVALPLEILARLDEHREAVEGQPGGLGRFVDRQLDFAVLLVVLRDVQKKWSAMLDVLQVQGAPSQKVLLDVLVPDINRQHTSVVIIWEYETLIPLRIQRLLNNHRIAAFRPQADLHVRVGEAVVIHGQQIDPLEDVDVQAPCLRGPAVRRFGRRRGHFDRRSAFIPSFDGNLQVPTRAFRAAFFLQRDPEFSGLYLVQVENCGPQKIGVLPPILVPNIHNERWQIGIFCIDVEMELLVPHRVKGLQLIRRLSHAVADVELDVRVRKAGFIRGNQTNCLIHLDAQAPDRHPLLRLCICQTELDTPDLFSLHLKTDVQCHVVAHEGQGLEVHCPHTQHFRSVSVQQGDLKYGSVNLSDGQHKVLGPLGVVVAVGRGRAACLSVQSHHYHGFKGLGGLHPRA
mmetsp:Transcript_72440/g.121641  ORF Transcript_72440/g.121641 Transcript_72440/m.121641 type:complete len:658 (-) Transcript_72440:219-2192(-)